MTNTETSTKDDPVGDVGAHPPDPAERMVLQMWRTPVYQADCTGAAVHLPNLRDLVLEADRTDRRAGASGGISAIRSSQTMLTWRHPSIDWLRVQIADAGRALARAALGDDAGELDDHVVRAEAWALICRAGESPRPHTRHDSAWSGLLSVAAEPGGDGDAGYLRMRDPRPAAGGRAASAEPVRYSLVPGRMIGFPGWQAHWMTANATASPLRIAIAWNITYHERRGRAS